MSEDVLVKISESMSVKICYKCYDTPSLTPPPSNESLCKAAEMYIGAQYIHT